MGTRRPNGDGSIHEMANGSYRGQATITGPDGKKKRVSVCGRNETDARDKLKMKVRQIQRDLDQGLELVSGRSPTVDAWLQEWLVIKATANTPSTMRTYRGRIQVWAIPAFKGLRLDQLTTEHVENLYDELKAAGLTSSTVHSMHRTLRAAFNVAVKRRWMTYNPVRNAEPGRLTEAEVVPLSLEEARAILDAAQKHRSAARWQIALSMGLRQGEALALRWSDIDFGAKTLTVRHSLYRAKWRHGCGPHPTEVEHPSCGLMHARSCPDREGGGLRLGEPKSRESRRTLALSEAMVRSLQAHRRSQMAERLAAGDRWRGAPPGDPECFVFATALGAPTDGRRDWGTWKELLSEAGVRDARVHDARHSAATFMLVTGVDPRTLMGTLGWSQQAMVNRYAHLVPELRAEVASRMSTLLFESQETINE